MVLIEANLITPRGMDLIPQCGMELIPICGMELVANCGMELDANCGEGLVAEPDTKDWLQNLSPFVSEGQPFER